MADSLENRIGSALAATHFQMQMSDAKEGLSYMHEHVEKLRHFGNPWNDLGQYYQLHFELCSFLFHMGFAEFEIGELEKIYSKIWYDYYQKMDGNGNKASLEKCIQEKVDLQQ